MGNAHDLRALAARTDNPDLSARLEADARQAHRAEVMADVVAVAIGAALATLATIAIFII